MARDDRRHYHHAHCSPKIFHTRGRQLHRHTPSRLRTLIAETAALAGAEVVVGVGAALTVEQMRFCGEENFMLPAFHLVDVLCCTASQPHYAYTSYCPYVSVVLSIATR